MSEKSSKYYIVFVAIMTVIGLILEVKNVLNNDFSTMWAIPVCFIVLFICYLITLIPERREDDADEH